MRFLRFNRDMRILLNCLVPFTLTLAVGFVALGLFLRSPSNQATAIHRTMSGEPIATQSGNDKAGDAAEATKVDPSDNTLESHNRTQLGADYKAGNSIVARPITSEPAPGNDRTAAQPAKMDGAHLTTMYQNGLSTGTPSVPSTNVSAVSGGNQNGASNSSGTTASDANNSVSEYPPRRIPWHQSFTVEQEWYRSWYGWGAL